MLDGHTDTVPDILGRLGAPISLAIFTEGNHFPTLLGGEIIDRFRAWARAQTQYAELAMDNIAVVTLPQPMIVGMLLGGGLSLGNLTIEVSRASGFYPDIVMAGAAPLTQLRRASLVEAEARIFARNRGPSLLVLLRLCAMVMVPGAEKFFSTIAMAQAIDPLRASAAKPFRNSFSEPFARSIRATASRR